MRFVFAMAALTALSVTAPAAADEEPTIGNAEIRNDLLRYYAGERLSGWLVGGVGAAEVGAGIALATRHGDFARGLGWAWVGFGGLELLGGLGYAIGVGGEIDQFGGLLAEDPAAFREKERAHIHGTTSRFIYYRITELVLLLGGAGVATYGFAANKDAFKGAGIGIAVAALPIVVLDTINNARAATYERHLDRFEPSLAILPGGAALTLGGAL